jgi:hypothetical protein
MCSNGEKMEKLNTLIKAEAATHCVTVTYGNHMN